MFAGWVGVPGFKGRAEGAVPVVPGSHNKEGLSIQRLCQSSVLYHNEYGMVADLCYLHTLW